jgi:predicted RNA binding protein YcfA (HicA-like mRNA interferase family)
MIRSDDIKKLTKKYNMELVKRKGKHPRWKNLDTGIVITTSGSPSDRNAIKNVEKDFKRAGLQLPIAA